MSLQKYRTKRHVETTPEPFGEKRKAKSDVMRFCVHKHAATHLHYDLRLEYHGVLLSWAVPKGPSMNPLDKRLAIQVEDHPYDYQFFEGIIPKGNYGAGKVEIWDQGFYTLPAAHNKRTIEKIMTQNLEKGHISLILHGERLEGEFTLQKMKKDPEDRQWLLIKKNEVKLLPAQNNSDALGRFSHTEKVYWPEENYTKGDLLSYYESMASYILPYLKGRPIMLHRFPEGIQGEEFYQKNFDDIDLKGVKTFPVQHEGRVVHYLLIDNLKSLLHAINLGSIDLHPFLSRCQKLHQPDFCVIDLDPHDIDFKYVIQAAQLLHDHLQSLNIPHYCKTSGGKGLHICIPLNAKYDFDQSVLFAEIVALHINQQIPKQTSLERNPEKRRKKIYLDCWQNRFGQTLVAPYVVRPRPKAPVSTPLIWDEVTEDLDVTQFNIKTILPRVKHTGDLFKPVLGKGIDLNAALKRMDIIDKKV